jgi:hypothetical protein
VHKRIISAVKKVEFVRDKMSYIILRGRWCVLNVHAPIIVLYFLIFKFFHSRREGRRLWTKW